MNTIHRTDGETVLAGCSWAGRHRTPMLIVLEYLPGLVKPSRLPADGCRYSYQWSFEGIQVTSAKPFRPTILA
jgi:hypothetical protein